MLSPRTEPYFVSGKREAHIAADRARRGGVDVIDYLQAPAARPHGIILEAASEAIRSGTGASMPSLGHPRLRSLIAARLAEAAGISVSAEDVAVTAGGRQALFLALMAVLGEGDEVIVFSPYWATFPAQVHLLNCRPVFVDTRNTGYMPSIERTAAAVTSRTRAIIINHPHHPTGTVYTASVLEGLCDLAISQNLWVIVDNTYDYAVFDRSAYVHPLGMTPEVRSRLILIDTFSKSLALPGWRIGFMASPKPIIDATKRLQAHLSDSPNVISQLALTAYLSRPEASFGDGLPAGLAHARSHGLAILAGLRDVGVAPADAGAQFYLDVAPLGAAVRDVGYRAASGVAAKLLGRLGTALLAADGSGDPHGLVLRFDIEDSRWASGLARIVDHLNGLERIDGDLGSRSTIAGWSASRSLSGLKDTVPHVRRCHSGFAPLTTWKLND